MIELNDALLVGLATMMYFGGKDVYFLLRDIVIDLYIQNRQENTE